MSLGKQPDPHTDASDAAIRAMQGRWRLAGVLLIAGLALLVYFPSLSGGFVLDDDIYLTDNPFIRTADGLYRFWCTTEPLDYYPASNTTLWLEWRLWGMNPTGYHLTNLALHIAAALLIWVILRKLSIPGAFLAALLFVVHPVNVESVAWISQRKGLLALVFFLLSIFWYLRDEETLAARGNGQRITQWYWLSLLAFLLAMLSKGSVAILPLALLLIVWWRRRLVKSDLLRMAPFFAIAALLAAVNVWCQARLSEQPFRTADFIQRLDAAAGVLWFYLAKALLPIHLLLVYPQWHVQTSNVLWWLPLLAVVIMTAVLRRHLHSPYANWVRPNLFAGAFFCISLLPVLGFTDVGFMEYSLVANHYLYIALIAVLALVAAGFSVWHDQARGPFRSAAMVAAVALVSTFALASWQQNRLYDNAITLYQATLNDNPDCWMVQNNLGSALIDVGRLPEAIAHLQKALRLTPGFAQAHFNLGTALHYSGRLPEAIEQFEQALQLKPNYSQAHNNLGNLLRQAGQLPAAIEHYQRAAAA